MPVGSAGQRDQEIPGTGGNRQSFGERRHLEPGSIAQDRHQTPARSSQSSGLNRIQVLPP